MSSTPLHLPPLLPYPITLLSLTPPATTINRADPLLTYAYTHHPPARSAEPPERRSGRWLSPVSGSLGPWAVAKGDVVAGPREVGTVDEECAHPVQLGGLCAVCGLDLTVCVPSPSLASPRPSPSPTFSRTRLTRALDLPPTRSRSDYLSEGFSDPSASSSSAAPSGPSASSSSLSISHSTPLLRVSHREASRLHSTHQAHLHSARKLLLIVDLDQTVVHATVDPTVGGFLDDVARADGGERGLGAEARRNLGEVGKFTLDEKGGRGCWYYLKPRFVPPSLPPSLPPRADPLPGALKALTWRRSSRASRPSSRCTSTRWARARTPTLSAGSLTLRGPSLAGASCRGTRAAVRASLHVLAPSSSPCSTTDPPHCTRKA